MKKITFFLIINLLLSSCHKFKDFIPLPATPQFNKTFGGSSDDEAFSVTASPDGGYVMAGYTNSSDGDVSGKHAESDAWVVKLNREGNIQWQRALGGADFEEANHITTTSDGGYIVAGFTDSHDGDVSGHHGEVGISDAWVVKLDREGNIQWQRALGGSGFDHATSITTTSDGGYIFTGSTSSNDGDVSGNHGGGDVWVVKLDREGNLLWQRALGGSGFDKADDITTTPDGGYIIVGDTQSNDGDVSGHHGSPNDAWVVKLDREGNLLWQKTLGGSASDGANSISPTLDGGYIIAGGTTSNDGDVTGNHGDADIWVVKIDGNGNIRWQKTFGGSGFDLANSITTAWDGGYIIAGATRSNDGDVSGYHGVIDAWILKLGKQGNLQWQKTLGGINWDMAHSISKTQYGHYIMAGTTQGNDEKVDEDLEGRRDAWIVTLKD